MDQMIEQNRSMSHSFSVFTREALEDRDKSIRTAPQTKCSTLLPLPRSAYPYFAYFYRLLSAKARRHSVQREIERVLGRAVHAKQEIEKQLATRCRRRSDVGEGGGRQKKPEQLERIE